MLHDFLERINKISRMFNFSQLSYHRHQISNSSIMQVAGNTREYLFLLPYEGFRKLISLKYKALHRRVQACFGKAQVNRLITDYILHQGIDR